jgi:hypothetical protein
VAGVLALLSVALVPAAPGYDPQAWLLWGREVAELRLSTAEGPAFKPLPVVVCALLAPLGDAAPEAWMAVARAGALLAVALAAVLAARLAGGSRVAGAVAAAGLALAGGFPALAGQGGAEGWAAAFALGAALAVHDRRPRAALAAGVGLALLRVEAWPFLAAGGAVLWWRRPADRPLLAVLALAVPAAWLVPEWLGSGDLLRSSERARVPNPGQPALAAVPSLASLGQAAGVPLAPVALGALALLAPRLRAPRAAGALALAGLAWVLLVAAMSELGYSGEPRYALPGVALLTAAGAVGLRALAGARAGRRLGAALALAVLAAAVPRVAALSDLRAGLRSAHELDADLARAVRAAGGRDAVLRCGRPYVGPLRGPLLAWHLDVEKRVVGFAPRAPGVVFRSRLRDEPRPAPAAPAGFAPHASAGRWEVLATCRSGAQARSGRSGRSG